MTAALYPPVDDLLPHAGQMVYLGEVLEHRKDGTACSIEVDAQPHFRDASGEIPSWVGLEYLAQTVAAHGGLLERAQGRPPRVGFLLGARRVSYYTSRFLRGQRLVARVTHRWGGTEGVVTFTCVLEDRVSGQVLVEGNLNCMWPKDATEVQRILGES